jgi:hypothetical protein
MSRIDKLFGLKQAITELIDIEPVEKKDASCQTDTEMKFDTSEMVSMVCNSAGTIVYYSGKDIETGKRNRSSSFDEKVRKAVRFEEKSVSSRSMLDNLSTFSVSPIETSPQVSVSEYTTTMQSRSCYSCKVTWEGELDILKSFGLTRANSTGRRNIHTTCRGCRQFRKAAQKESANITIVGDDVSVLGTSNRHTTLTRNGEFLCHVRMNGESWEQAQQRLKSKYSTSFIKDRRDEMLKVLCSATDVPLEEGYVVFNHLTDTELMYKVKKLRPSGFRTMLTRAPN